MGAITVFVEQRENECLDILAGDYLRGVKVSSGLSQERIPRGISSLHEGTKGEHYAQLSCRGIFLLEDDGQGQNNWVGDAWAGGRTLEEAQLETQ